jgi:putative flavoprotein involved in K+ transport
LASSQFVGLLIPRLKGGFGHHCCAGTRAHCPAQSYPDLAEELDEGSFQTPTISGVANVPRFPGAETFKGVQHHSSQHPGGEEFRGKRAVVIGSNNSAHDICADLWEHGADVTMVQRTSTHIARSDTLMELGLGSLYSEQAVANGISTDKADLIFAYIPYKILHEFQIPVYQEMARRGVDHLTEHSVVLTDGTELPADLVVYATGYGSMNGWAAKLISQDVADKVGKCWGLGSNTTKDPGPWEGEQRNMWKPTRQEALWFHGGNLHQSRHYSQFLALQLKARMEGIPTPVYGLAEVYHTA